MKVLGIESSCDETAASVVEDGRRILSHVVVTQIDIHAHYGGVVPEIAARSHIEAINPVIEEALAQAGCAWDDIDAIAATYAPGLIGSLLVGTLAARTLAVLHDKPLYPIHHVEAHVYANFVVEQGPPLPSSPTPPELPRGSLHAGPANESAPSSEKSEILSEAGAAPLVVTRFNLPTQQPSFPMLALIVSGGHTQLVLFHDHGDYELLGQTQDDAVGEAFDKVAKILGLPYPGGPSIAKAAERGDARKYQLPKAKLSGKYDFSFSGLKTAVLRAVQHEVGKDFTFPSHELPGLLNDVQRDDFAASFQCVAVETLADRTVAAARDYAPKSVVIAGGVAANRELRRQLAEKLPIAIEYAPIELCTDNGTMVAALGYYQAQRLDPCDPYTLEVQPTSSLKRGAWAMKG